VRFLLKILRVLVVGEKEKVGGEVPLEPGEPHHVGLLSS
jgi:hypothetical protein